MLKKISILLSCAILALSFSGCTSNKNAENQSNESKIKISATFNALKEFAQAVGKEKVEISTIIPDGMEAHDFEPKPQDIKAINDAKIFIYNGLEMDSWAEDAISSANNKDLIAVCASDGADLIETETSANETDEEHHGKYDPHLWLSLKGAQTEALNIKEALVKADPANKDYYEKNFSEFKNQLEELYNEYKEKFESVQNKNFVTGHAAFGYLCRDFGLSQNSVSDIFAEGEPSPKQLANLVNYCKENNVKTIFAEEMASPDVSKTLANEVGAKVETIYTIENNEDDKTYLERMSENLSKIYQSLKE